MAEARGEAVTTSVRELQVRAVLQIAPCDACWHAARCRSECLACAAFALFMDGAKPPRWSAINRTPTRARFTELLGA